MAERDSYSKSNIKRIHNELILELVNGHVGHSENTRTYTNWKMRFKNYCDQTTEIDGNVRSNFQYLEDHYYLNPGNYKVLEQIFNGDKDALEKIQTAAYKIQIIRNR